MSRPSQIAYTSLAGVSFGLGVVGLFLPLMPTTCFMLLAVWLATKGSPRFALWIRSHPRFGPSIQAWEHERAIPRHAKTLAVSLLLVSCAILIAVLDSLLLRGILAVGLSLLALWIATRPEPGRRPPVRPMQEMQEERLAAQRLGR
ncbi:MAG: YbaN family protein [Halomonas sp.]|nr:YbaN family protein [Halomonas sp.]